MARLRLPAKQTSSLRVAPAGIAAVGQCAAPSDRLPLRVAVHMFLTIGALLVFATGDAFGTVTTSVVLSAAILLFGLPHGTLDLALIQKAHANSNLVLVALLYCGCASAMYAAWKISPALAMIIFFALSIRHFAEDWVDRLPPAFAHGTAIALLAAPAIFHQATLTSLFAFLVESRSAAIAVDVAILIAPIAIAVASVGVIAMWADGHREMAVTTSMSLVGMIFLPPLVGFTLFFCLMHSPTQFAAGLGALGWRRPREWAGPVVGLTVAALGIAAAIYHGTLAPAISQSMIVTAFVTLSVLTLPHMVMPFLVRRLSDYRLKSV